MTLEEIILLAQEAVDDYEDSLFEVAAFATGAGSMESLQKKARERVDLYRKAQEQLEKDYREETELFEFFSLLQEDYVLIAYSDDPEKIDLENLSTEELQSSLLLLEKKFSKKDNS